MTSSISELRRKAKYFREYAEEDGYDAEAKINDLIIDYLEKIEDRLENGPMYLEDR